jgi:competence CoiA-like predicted nuclease
LVVELNMLYAWVDGLKRSPLTKGERTVCPDCGNLVTAVIPVENVRHWRHKAGDCDRWSEPEGDWHLNWKEQFDITCREIGLVDPLTRDRHRADVLCGAGTERATVLELQHSSISEDERDARETFYRRGHRMFWLIHLHDETSFLAANFRLSLDFESRTYSLDGHSYAVMRWVGRSQQFIEKWKRAKAYVFFDWGGRIFHLAGEGLSIRLGGPFKRGDFAICHLTRESFVRAVRGQG